MVHSLGGQFGVQVPCFGRDGCWTRGGGSVIAGRSSHSLESRDPSRTWGGGAGEAIACHRGQSDGL